MLAVDEVSERGLSLICDITEPASVRAAMARTVERFGRRDIIGNNAGGSGRAGARVTDAAEEEFWRLIKVEFTARSCAANMAFL